MVVPCGILWTYTSFSRELRTDQLFSPAHEQRAAPFPSKILPGRVTSARCTRGKHRRATEHLRESVDKHDTHDRHSIVARVRQGADADRRDDARRALDD